MTNAQVSGNLMYAAALQQLTRLAAAKNMTDCYSANYSL